MDSAEATLAHALSTAERVGDRMIEGQAHYALGEIAAARADDLTSAAHMNKAKALFTELGSAMWLAKCLILLSEVHDTGTEDLDQARELLSKIGSKESNRLLHQLEDARTTLLSDDIVETALTD